MQLSKAYSNQLCQFMYKFPFSFDFTPYIVYIHNNSIITIVYYYYVYIYATNIYSVCTIITTIHSTYKK